MALSSFGSDNHSGIHPKVLAAIAEANHGHAHSYGEDPWSQRLHQELKRVIPQSAEAFLVFNGTAANVLALKTGLKSYQSCLCADVSHLNLDECAAPERIAGRKLIPLPTSQGKLEPETLAQAITRRGDQHFAQVGLLSITQPTELGTVYTLEELREIHKFCLDNRIMLHIDGARLANAARFLNVSWEEMLRAASPDLLSLGGTKNGLMGAEALVVFEQAKHLVHDLKYYRKQTLQLSSKTRFLAAQMLAYLEADLYSDIAELSLKRAQELQSLLPQTEKLKVLYPVESNALFVQFPKAWTKRLRDKHFFYIWDDRDWVARWMTSFDTTSEDIASFVNELNHILKEEE